MYIKEESIFDHQQLINGSTPETLTDNPGKSTKGIYWIIGLGVVFIGCTIGYYIYHYGWLNKKKKRSDTIY